MKHDINITFYLAGNKCAVNQKNPLWNKKMPGGSTDHHIKLTYGSYFDIINAFIQDNIKDILKKSNSVLLDSEPVCIILEKHGEFYHPAHMKLTTSSGKTRHFVINLAESEAGISLIEQEFALLKRLGEAIPGNHIPSVYSIYKQEMGAGRMVCLFTGDWLDNYHEFHISKHESTGHQGYIVWDQAHGNFYLSEKQINQMYCKISEILTCFYDPDTFEQILPWHHAAGDFIIRCEADDIDVKLITVRQYTSQIQQDGNPDIGEVLDALLYFLINLSIRTRLDRNNGTEETIWADDLAVSPTIAGFFKALNEKKSNVIPGSITTIFCKYIELNYTLQDLLDIAESIMTSYNPKSTDFPLIHQNLTHHITLLYQEIKKFDESKP